MKMRDQSVRKKGDICRILWQDPEMDAGWSDELKELEVVTSVGIFLKENERTIWFSSTYHAGTKESADIMTYPKGVILHVEVIGKV